MNTVAVGRRPNAIQNMDLDGDGVDELLVVNFDDATVAVVDRENSATGLPRGVVGVVPVGKGPLATSPAIDLDGDGRRDIVVANRDDGSVSVLRSRGDRSFDVSTYRVGPQPGAVNAADLDGDGKPEIIASNGGGSTVTVLVNRGDGTFAAGVDYAVGGAPAFAVVNDIDGDGPVDLVVPSGDGVLTILKGVGDATFPQAMRVPLPSGATARGSAQLVDVNGNGNLGVAMALPATHEVALVTNRMDGYVRLVEFSRKAHDGSDRFFITSAKAEIEALDSGAIEGWSRTGASFRAYARGGRNRANVCRFYAPGLGTHFFTADAVECEVLAREHADVWVPETPAAFHIAAVSRSGCAAGLNPVYRLFDPIHVTHRNTSNKAQRDRLVASGWIAEGPGPDGAAMCAP
jgi:hypothetical protein